MREKQRYTRLIDKLSSFKADIEDILRQAEEVYQACQVSGYMTQKVAGKEAIDLTERLPSVAIQAVTLKLAAIKWISEQAALEETLYVDDDATIIKVVYSEVKD